MTIPPKHYSYLGPFIICTTQSKPTIQWRFGCPTHGGEWGETDNYCNLCGQLLRRHTYETCEGIHAGIVWDAFMTAGLEITDDAALEGVFKTMDHEQHHFVPPDELWLVPTDTPNRFVQGTEFALTDLHSTDEQYALRKKYAKYFAVLEELFGGLVRTEFGMIGYWS